VIGRTYKDIIQDMVDWYAQAQSDSAVHGGWQYNAFNNTGGNQDNSAAGWAATGLVAAEDVFGATIPDWLKTRNQNGLEFTDNESDTNDAIAGNSSGTGGDGIHGYNSPRDIFGPYGTSGAGMVQMSMNALEATTSATPDERWVRTENFFRRNFDNTAGTGYFKSYYYGMFNFAKAMRTAKPAAVNVIGTVVGVADDAVNGIGCGPNPGCAAGGPSPLDWYNDPDSGLAAAVTSYQQSSGADIGRFLPRGAIYESNHTGRHLHAWGTQILTRTLAQAGPIAVAILRPNPAGENFRIELDHSQSFHQDPARSLVQFEWDIDNDGTYDLSTPDLVPDPPLDVPGGYDCVAAGGLPCSHILNLRVTDDADPPVSTTDVVVLDLTIPPHAPTANAGGPYLTCVNEELTLDGTGSFDVDEGQSEDGAAGTDTITAYEWELDGLIPFDYGEAVGDTATWTFTSVGVAPIGLRVTDNSSVAYPSASEVDLTDTDNTTVSVANCIDADLSVSVASSNDNPIIPDTVTITVTISNGGPDDATDVFILGDLANLVTISSITPSQGSCSATGTQTETQDEYRCDLGDIPAGTSVDVVVEIFGDTEGSAQFDFTVDVVGGPLLQLADPDASNNTFTAVIVLIDEVIIVVEGRGAGSIGLASLFLFGAAGLGIWLMRRQRARAAAIGASLAAVLLVVSMVASPVADASEHKGFFIGAAIGKATSDVSASSFEAGLTAAGYSVSDVTLDDSASGWKATVGYMFNEYVGVQGSYVDLGELDSQFTASVPPDQIDALLEAGTMLLPGRGEGFLADLLLQYPFSERVSGYITLGVFFAEPDSTQTVISGGTGTSMRSDDDNDFAGSVGIKFQAGDRFDIKIGFERYDIDGNSTDFPMAAIVYRFGGNK
jgi:uncharacterized repeat protein (TIGR01451 family)